MRTFANKIGSKIYESHSEKLNTRQRVLLIFPQVIKYFQVIGNNNSVASNFQNGHEVGERLQKLPNKNIIDVMVTFVVRARKKFPFFRFFSLIFFFFPTVIMLYAFVALVASELSQQLDKYHRNLLRKRGKSVERKLSSIESLLFYEEKEKFFLAYNFPTVSMSFFH